MYDLLASSSSSRSPSALTPPGPGFNALISIDAIPAGPEISIPFSLNPQVDLVFPNHHWLQKFQGVEA